MSGFFALFRGSRSGLVGFAITATLLCMALFAPWLAPADPNVQSVADQFAPPIGSHPFGQDNFGRDTLSRVIYGSRVSLTIGFLSVLIGGTIGTLAGIFAALQGGRADRLVLRFTDVLMSFPTLILSILVVVALGPNFINTVIAVAVAMVPKFIRYARGPTLSIREQEFVQGAVAAGAGRVRVLFRHVLPLVMGPVTVMGALWVGIAIRIEASLSFLGVGVPPPTAAWGSMLKEGVEAMLFTPWLALFPGLAIMITILGLNLLGDWLRDIFDPHLKSMFRAAESDGERAGMEAEQVPAFSNEEMARLG
ncbi:ABC transporter permease [Nitrospinota bacterium]